MSKTHFLTQSRCMPAPCQWEVRMRTLTQWPSTTLLELPLFGTCFSLWWWNIFLVQCLYSHFHIIFKQQFLFGTFQDSKHPILSFSAAAAAKSHQSCPTLCDPMDGSPPGSPVPGTLQAKTLERVAISFSNAWKWKVKVKSLSHVRLWATPWTAAHQAPPSMGFSRQEYWSGVPLPSPFSLLKSE